ncbi:MAG: 2-amino-4-hydroxy-6-hydroxymethyldihydropteridine diphosphokinase [Prolixibacteraceae bacterium]|jgi:2-amino-4-hydroxy-6-hydroxymethyldihydropteridine diphosphokinase|nr:2-amino-4-hydroxy-6-hydroxymethyldihydropteridine diphosphokinase [Prolixibacteraceae bacterium]
MEELYLLLGGNLGDKQQIFSETERLIGLQLGRIVKKSHVYETEPWGFESDDLFWNQAIVVETGLTETKCLHVIHQIEKEVGRIRYNRQYSSRIIDIDILFYGDHVVLNHELEIPHPRMVNRKFVLVPLSEIAPDKLHPVWGKTIGQLLADCPDTLRVTMLETPFVS